MAPDWAEALAPVDERIAAMGQFLRAELAAGRATCRPVTTILRAFQRPLADVRVLVVGQDPYPTPGPPDRAVASRSRTTCGRCRASLRNIYTELRADLGLEPPAARRPHGLGRPGRDAAQPGADRAARRARLAPRRGLGGGHRSARSTALAAPRRPVRRDPVGPRRRSRSRPMLGPIPWVESAHPSPLSAHRGFFGSRPVQPGQPAARRAGRRTASTGAARWK